LFLPSSISLHRFWQFYERYKDDAAWSVHALDCLHDIMLEKPDELNKILIEDTT